ncbi:hypothetical protein BHE90_002386 [Fusarium euwallaceae]|uniref:Uncharacterized protein n=1 Tax=Fusarium euwallaceae TaxID=1147111 RepID=A0A430M530_9HYPO|nr:hypothetical protein BHE90_002386 [Fusarium euwallaceae]
MSEKSQSQASDTRTLDSGTTTRKERKSRFIEHFDISWNGISRLPQPLKMTTNVTPDEFASDANMAKVSTVASEGDLVDISKFRSTVAGFFNENYASTGAEFIKATREKTGIERVRRGLDDLWLQIQLFHDLMIRIQPNNVTSNPENLAQAVDLILDVSHWRLKADLDAGLDEDKARDEIVILHRRLRRMEFMIRETINLCGKPPKVLGGCIVRLKRPKYKERLWTRLFGTEPGEQNRNEDRSFRVRDVAGLLRLEDYLTFVSTEFDRQLGEKRANAQSGVIMAAIAHFDDEIQSFLKKKDCRTSDELKVEWAAMILTPGFRKVVAREMANIVNDGLAYRKKNGYTTHREDCELFTKLQSSIARVISSVSMKGDGGRRSISGSPLTPVFLRKDSAASKASKASKK